MRRISLFALLVVAAILLSACQASADNPLTTSGPGTWNASLWDTATWE